MRIADGVIGKPSRWLGCRSTLGFKGDQGMGGTEGGAGIEAQIADLRAEADMAREFGFPDSGKVMDAAASTIKRQQAVVRVLRSMDRRGLLGKELRDALGVLDAPPEGDG